jgi:hypothetical protein
MNETFILELTMEDLPKILSNYDSKIIRVPDLYMKTKDPEPYIKLLF